jgi:GT2 family glycosyltransferase
MVSEPTMRSNTLPTPVPSILIIIVTWNKKQYVLELLASLSTLDYPVAALDILVVDNASQDGTAAAIAASYPQVNVLCNQENLGGTGGFNTGLQWAFAQSPERYRYLWLLDNDVVVHRRALTELVAILEAKADVAVAGSTMMQLDYPWRINEMGAFLNRGLGLLVLHRHLETIPLWQGRSLAELLTGDADLTQHLIHCQPMMDVDYVAAASLLIRSTVAKQAGLWRDYFIHFDDVEWCLRIRARGYRVVVAARSLIWHLSAAAKVPTWVLYYDNRNILDLLATHGADIHHLQRIIQYIYKKAVYYYLIGKPDLAQLHYQAVADFKAKRYGKQAIQLTHHYQNNIDIQPVFLDPTIKRILIPWTVNLQATGIQEALIQAQLKRPELQVDCLIPPENPVVYQLPRAHFLPPLSALKIFRWLTYWRLRGCYDLVMQSDYQIIIGLSWLQAELLFINDEGFSRRPPPQLKQVWQAIIQWLQTKKRNF